MLASEQEVDLLSAGIDRPGVESLPVFDSNIVSSSRQLLFGSLQVAPATSVQFRTIDLTRRYAQLALIARRRTTVISAIWATGSVPQIPTYVTQDDVTRAMPPFKRIGCGDPCVLPDQTEPRWFSQRTQWGPSVLHRAIAKDSPV